MLVADSGRLGVLRASGRHRGRQPAHLRHGRTKAGSRSRGARQILEQDHQHLARARAQGGQQRRGGRDRRAGCSTSATSSGSRSGARTTTCCITGSNPDGPSDRLGPIRSRRHPSRLQRVAAALRDLDEPRRNAGDPVQHSHAVAEQAGHADQAHARRVRQHHRAAASSWGCSAPGSSPGSSPVPSRRWSRAPIESARATTPGRWPSCAATSSAICNLRSSACGRT